MKYRKEAEHIHIPIGTGDHLLEAVMAWPGDVTLWYNSLLGELCVTMQVCGLHYRRAVTVADFPRIQSVLEEMDDHLRGLAAEKYGPDGCLGMLKTKTLP